MLISNFTTLLPAICDRDTSQDPDNWTENNPLWGHCAVVSLLVQDLFGGTLLRVSLEGTPFAASRSHYYNRLPDGDIDFTAAQFGGYNTLMLPTEERGREYVLSYEPTRLRYEELKSRFLKLPRTEKVEP